MIWLGKKTPNVNASRLSRAHFKALFSLLYRGSVFIRFVLTGGRSVQPFVCKEVEVGKGGNSSQLESVLWTFVMTFNLQRKWMLHTKLNLFHLAVHFLSLMTHKPRRQKQTKSPVNAGNSQRNDWRYAQLRSFNYFPTLFTTSHPQHSPTDTNPWLGDRRVRPFNSIDLLNSPVDNWKMHSKCFFFASFHRFSTASEISHLFLSSGSCHN